MGGETSQSPTFQLPAARFCRAPAAPSRVSGLEHSDSSVRYGFTMVGCHNICMPLGGSTKSGKGPTPSHCGARDKPLKRQTWFVWSGLITTLVPCQSGLDQEGSLMGERNRKKGMREQPNSLHTSSSACVFVSVLQVHRCFKQSSAEVLPWTLLVHAQQKSFKHGPVKGTLFQTGTKCEEGRAERSVIRCSSWWSHSRTGTLELAVITSALVPRTASENQPDVWHGASSCR